MSGNCAVAAADTSKCGGSTPVSVLINGLITELPNYLAAAQDVIMPCEEDKVKWWRQQSDNLPHWSSAGLKVLLVQPSSAAAERVFSILNASFNDSQEHALVDYLQALPGWRLKQVCGL